MRVEGDAPELNELLFPHGLVPQILGLIVDVWASFTHPSDAEDEPKITNRFIAALQAEKRRRRARFRVMPHVKDVENVDPQTGKGFVEIDIYVPHGDDERCYFGIEAKKLNTTDQTGKWRSNAGEYAGPNGMGCFVEGRYAAHQCEGAMVGYVMDSDRQRARTSISHAIDERAQALRVSPRCTLHPAQMLPGCTDAFETRHNLDRGEFTLHHVLLAA
jgi:hypothetical protein